MCLNHWMSKNNGGNHKSLSQLENFQIFSQKLLFWQGKWDCMKMTKKYTSRCPNFKNWVSLEWYDEPKAVSGRMLFDYKKCLPF